MLCVFLKDFPTNHVDEPQHIDFRVTALVLQRNVLISSQFLILLYYRLQGEKVGKTQKVSLELNADFLVTAIDFLTNKHILSVLYVIGTQMLTFLLCTRVSIFQDTQDFLNAQFPSFQPLANSWASSPRREHTPHLLSSETT